MDTTFLSTNAHQRLEPPPHTPTPRWPGRHPLHLHPLHYTHLSTVQMMTLLGEAISAWHE